LHPQLAFKVRKQSMKRKPKGGKTATATRLHTGDNDKGELGKKLRRLAGLVCVTPCARL
jgi:hypothetical protein